MTGSNGIVRRFREPLFLCVVSIAGLLAALLGNILFKWLGVAAAALPMLAILRHGLRGRKASRKLR